MIEGQITTNNANQNLYQSKKSLAEKEEGKMQSRQDETKNKQQALYENKLRK